MKVRRVIIFACALFWGSVFFSFGQTKNKKDYVSQVNEITQNDSDFLIDVFKHYPEYFKEVTTAADKYKVQIIFTQINRLKDNKPVLKHHTFHLDTLAYFFPASMVKLPTVLLALEKINDLKIAGLNKFTPMKTQRGYSCQSATSAAEYSKEHGYASIAHYIKDVLVASGNLSYDRLYEFVGQKALNEKLWEKGYTSAQITSRYGSICTRGENRVTNPIIFMQGDTIIYSQPMETNPNTYKKEIKNIQVGKGQVQADGTIIYEPRDFTFSNSISLKDLHEILIATMLPIALPAQKRFRLTKEDYRFLHRYMSMVPTESKDPSYDRGYYNPCRMKYLVWGSECNTYPDKNIRIFNKVGLAAGFLTDCAYIVDFEAKAEFFLSATIYVSTDNIVGGNYNYYKVGMPFLKYLGQVLLDLERRRKKKNLPNLDFYKHDYSNY
jgi:hypothetical protein